MKQRKYLCIVVSILFLLPNSSCYAMHFLQEGLHTVKEWWDNSEGCVKGAIIGTGVVLGYVAWNERRHHVKNTRITQLENELTEKRDDIGRNGSAIQLLKLKVDCIEKCTDTIAQTFWQRDVTSFKEEPSAEICIDLFDTVKTNMEIKNICADITELKEYAAKWAIREKYFNSAISASAVVYQHFVERIKQVEECMKVAADSIVVRNNTVGNLTRKVKHIEMKLSRLKTVKSDVQEVIRIANEVKGLIEKK